MIVTPSSINDRRPPGTRSRLLQPLLLAVLGWLTVIASGCATPDIPSRQLGEILQQYPNAQEPLRIKMLSASSANDVDPALQGKAVTIMVHPAYSLFFRDEHRNSYTEAKYDLLKFQL